MDALLHHLDTALLLVLGMGALACAVAMLVLREPMRVAVALIGCMVLLGGIYGVLGMHVVAAFQVLLYVGAVMVFMVFVIMLLQVRDAQGPRWSALLLPGALGGGLVLAALLAAVWVGLPGAGTGGGQVQAPALPIGSFAVAFLSRHWLHFELTSVLLLAAVVAALAVIQAGRDMPSAASPREPGGD